MPKRKYELVLKQTDKENLMIGDYPTIKIGEQWYEIREIYNKWKKSIHVDKYAKSKITGLLKELIREDKTLLDKKQIKVTIESK